MYLGIEIGGTKVQIAIGAGQGELERLFRGDVDVDKGAPGILAWLRKEVPQALAAAPADDPVRGVGVGFGGPVDSARGRILISHQVGGWQDFEMKDWFERTFGLPTVVANDSNAAGWAEFKLGAGRGTQNMAYMNIGSGIGGALILEGRLYDGQGSGAGEIGHTFVTVPSGNGKGFQADRLENFCSGWAIERRARNRWQPETSSVLGRLTGGDADDLTCPLLAEAARQADPFALSAIEDVARAVGMAVGNLCSLFCPERVVLGGGVAGMGEVLLAPLRRFAEEHTIGALQGLTEIVPAELGEAVVPHGALLLAAENLPAEGPG